MNRKEFVKKTAMAAATAAVLPKFSFGAAKGSDKIKVALVGCGGRGTDALTNMIAADQNIEIIAIGDLFPERTKACTENVNKFIEKNYPAHKDIWQVKPETTFHGLEAIDKVLKTDADVVALITPPVFRTQHIEKALNAGKNIFAEKPICVDATQYRKICKELIPLADKLGLNVLCGTQMRYQTAIQEAMKRVHDGQIGEIVNATFLRYEPMYLTGWYDIPAHLKVDDVEYQLRKWLAFRWTSGDQYVEQYIHNLDVALWAFNALPVEAIGSGGRQTELCTPDMGDRQSNTHVLYTFKNGATLNAGCRQEKNTSWFSSFIVNGTKGTLFSGFGKQVIQGEKPWVGNPEGFELVHEHEALFSSLREGRHLNTMQQCADSCFIGIVGREAAYGGKRIKSAWIKEKSVQSYMPENLTLDMKKPLEPVPTPSEYKII